MIETRVYTDPNEITAEVADAMATAWKREYSRRAQAFKESLTPEQRALQIATGEAQNEATLAKYWASWRRGGIRFSQKRRRLPRFPGFETVEAELTSGTEPRFNAHERRP